MCSAAARDSLAFILVDDKGNDSFAQLM